MKHLKLVFLGLLTLACSHINPVGDGKTHLIRCHSWFKSTESCTKLAKEVCGGEYEVIARNSYFEMQKGPQRSVTVVCK
jgi:hypothetical protein